MDPSAQFRVSNRNGMISQVKRMKGGLDYFEMALDLGHGDSGGPVFLENGEVIGLNVATANEDAKGLTLAVPINIAKELLAKAKITPDPGPLTHLWEEGLRDYAAGRYDVASKEFGTVFCMQQVPFDFDGLVLPDYYFSEIPTSKYTNPAVGEMLSHSANRLLHRRPPGDSR